MVDDSKECKQEVMFAIAGKRYKDKCWVYECSVCYRNKLKQCCVGEGMYNRDCIDMI